MNKPSLEKFQTLRNYDQRKIIQAILWEKSYYYSDFGFDKASINQFEHKRIELYSILINTEPKKEEKKCKL